MKFKVGEMVRIKQKTSMESRGYNNKICFLLKRYTCLTPNLHGCKTAYQTSNNGLGVWEDEVEDLNLSVIEKLVYNIEENP